MNVKCIGQLLTCWLEQAPKREVRALCEQLQQCIGDQGNDGLTEVVHDDTPTVDLQGQGTAAQPLTATVNVSSEPGNALTVKPTGLYVQTGGEAGDTLPPIEMPDDEDAVLAVGPDGEIYWRRPQPCYVQTTAASTPTAADNGKLHIGGGIITLQASLPVGWRMDVKGAAEVAGDTGVIIQSMEGARNVVLNGGATIIKTSASTFWLAGAIE